MSGVRSRRVKLLEGMCRAICDRLHDRVADAARRRGLPAVPERTSAVYALAMAVAPDLLDELLSVFRLLGGEPGEGRRARSSSPPSDDADRRQMLSAVRATVGRSRLQRRLA